MKRKAKWLLMNGLFAVGVYLAFFEGVVGAERVVIFWTWVLLLASIGGQLEAAVEVRKARGYPAPEWVDVAFDTAMTVILVWAGAWVTACAYATHIVLCSVARGKAEAPPEEAQ